MIDTDVLKCKKFCWSLKRSTYVSDILTKKLCHLTAFKTTRWQQLASYVCGHKSTRVTNTVSKPDQHHVAKFKREKMSKELFFSSELTSSAISCGGKYTYLISKCSCQRNPPFDGHIRVVNYYFYQSLPFPGK
jgi:hypothetical protein